MIDHLLVNKDPSRYHYQPLLVLSPLLDVGFSEDAPISVGICLLLLPTTTALQRRQIPT